VKEESINNRELKSLEETLTLRPDQVTMDNKHVFRVMKKLVARIHELERKEGDG
jgi:hypothetical protein